MAVFFSVIFLMLSQTPVVAATEFADADSITLQTRTTYFVNFVLEGQQAELELNASQYQLLLKLQKLSLSQTLTDPKDEELEELVASINKAAVNSFGKALVVKSENGYHLYRSIAISADRLFQVFKRGVVYRGEEVVLTDKQTEIVQVLDTAPDRSMTFQELAQAVGWNGRNYRTNVRSYMESINSKTLEFAGAELLQVEGRGKSIRIAAVEPATYSDAGYSRVNGRIVRLDAAAFAVAEVIAESIRETVPPRELTISESEFKKINMTPSQILAGLRVIYAAAGVSQERVKVIFPAGEETIHLTLDGSSKRRVRGYRGRGACAAALL